MALAVFDQSKPVESEASPKFRGDGRLQIIGVLANPIPFTGRGQQRDQHAYLHSHLCILGSESEAEATMTSPNDR